MAKAVTAQAKEIIIINQSIPAPADPCAIPLFALSHAHARIEIDFGTVRTDGRTDRPKAGWFKLWLQLLYGTRTRHHGIFMASSTGTVLKEVSQVIPYAQNVALRESSSRKSPCILFHIRLIS
jgi:hypothetical protein